MMLCFITTQCNVYISNFASSSIQRSTIVVTSHLIFVGANVNAAMSSLIFCRFQFQTYLNFASFLQHLV